MIVTDVRWYLRYPLAYENVSELLTESGLPVDASCIWRWVRAYAPELRKRCRPYLKSTNKSYRVHETSRSKGERSISIERWIPPAKMIDFLLTAKRDTAAAKRFFQRASNCFANPVPRVINVDKNPAYPAAVRSFQNEGVQFRRVRLRQCKFLNNIIEQDIEP